MRHHILITKTRLLLLAFIVSQAFYVDRLFFFFIAMFFGRLLPSPQDETAKDQPTGNRAWWLRDAKGENLRYLLGTVAKKRMKRGDGTWREGNGTEGDDINFLVNVLISSRRFLGRRDGTRSGPVLEKYDGTGTTMQQHPVA